MEGSIDQIAGIVYFKSKPHNSLTTEVKEFHIFHMMRTLALRKVVRLLQCSSTVMYELDF